MSARGRFSWYDLMTTDTEAGKAFYTELIGWGVEAWQGPMPYSMWTQDGTALGGVADLPEEAKANGAPPYWLAYVAVDDVDATVARATELGAAVYVPAQDIPDTGRFSVLADPQGAVFAVYSSAKAEAGDDAAAGVGRFSWHELAAENYETAFAFYADLFGWVQGDVHDMGPDLGNYAIYSRREGTTPLGGMFNKPADMPAAWVLYIRVDDVTKAAARVSELGGNVVNGPMEVPGGDVIAQCVDPQGAFFALHSTAG